MKADIRDQFRFLILRMPITQVAAQLGIAEATARRWVQEDRDAEAIDRAGREVRRFDAGPQPSMISRPPKRRRGDRQSGPN